MMDKDLLLRDFEPESMLVVNRRAVNEPLVPAIDVHVHLRGADIHNGLYDIPRFVRGMQEHGIKHVVDLDGFFGSALEESLRAKEGYEQYITTFGTVDVSQIDEKHFEEKTRRDIIDGYNRGMRGLKFLKSLSLVYKDSKGRYIPPDDDRLSVIWRTAAELKIPVLIHIADPIAFFQPLDHKNERYEEISSNPDWHFGDAQFFRFEQLMQMQDNLLSKNPDTTFIIAHIGSHSENLGFVSKQLDAHPNMYVDIAARISDLGRQPYSAHDFMVRYQDRVLYGTDILVREGTTRDPFGICRVYYECLETKNEYFPANLVEQQGRWNIYGLNLPEQVLRKVYSENAQKLLGIRCEEGL